MPIYDWLCPKCGGDYSELLTFSAYDEWESAACPSCGEKLTKDDRVLGKGLKTTVNGVSKGNYGSSDWS